MKPLFTILSLGCMLLAFPQESKVYFDDALSQYLVPYIKQSNEAINNHDFERAKILFDSLFEYHLKGTYIPNIRLHTIPDGIIETDSLKLPFLLITKSSQPVQSEEIEAINALASEYKGEVETIVLYWDTLENVKKLEKKYSKDVLLTYIDETQNKSEPIVKTFKHSFGAPVCFFISHKKQLVSLNRKFELSKENADNIQITTSSDTYKTIALMLFEFENSTKGILTTLDNDDDDPDH